MRAESRTCLEPNMRVLDTVCGALGPTLDMVRAVSGLEVDGAILSVAQKSGGRRRRSRLG